MNLNKLNEKLLNEQELSLLKLYDEKAELKSAIFESKVEKEESLKLVEMKINRLQDEIRKEFGEFYVQDRRIWLGKKTNKTKKSRSDKRKGKGEGKITKEFVQKNKLEEVKERVGKITKEPKGLLSKLKNAVIEEETRRKLAEEELVRKAYETGKINPKKKIEAEKEELDQVITMITRMQDPSEKLKKILSPEMQDAFRKIVREEMNNNSNDGPKRKLMIAQKSKERLLKEIAKHSSKSKIYKKLNNFELKNVLSVINNEFFSTEMEMEEEEDKPEKIYQKIKISEFKEKLSLSKWKDGICLENENDTVEKFGNRFRIEVANLQWTSQLQRNFISEKEDFNFFPAEGNTDQISFEVSLFDEETEEFCILMVCCESKRLSECPHELCMFFLDDSFMKAAREITKLFTPDIMIECDDKLVAVELSTSRDLETNVQVNTKRQNYRTKIIEYNERPDVKPIILKIIAVNSAQVRVTGSAPEEMSVLCPLVRGGNEVMNIAYHSLGWRDQEENVSHKRSLEIVEAIKRMKEGQIKEKDEEQMKIDKKYIEKLKREQRRMIANPNVRKRVLRRLKKDLYSLAKKDLIEKSVEETAEEAIKKVDKAVDEYDSRVNCYDENKKKAVVQSSIFLPERTIMNDDEDYWFDHEDFDKIEGASAICEMWKVGIESARGNERENYKRMSVQEMLDKIQRESPAFDKETFKTEINETIIKNEALSEIAGRKDSRKRQRVKIPLTPSMMQSNEIGLVGVSGKKSAKKFGKLFKEKREESQKHFSIRDEHLFSSDIEEYLNDETWFEKRGFTMRESDDIELLAKKAEEISGNDNSLRREIDDMSQRKIFQIMEIQDRINTELVISMSQYTEENAFVMKKLRGLSVYLLIKPTSKGEIVFYSVAVRKNDCQLLSTVFKQPIDAGKFWIFPFVSTKEAKSSHFQNITEKAIALYFNKIDVFEQGNKRPEEITEICRKQFLFQVLFMFENKTSTSTALQQLRFFYMEITCNRILTRCNPLKSMTKIDRFPRSRFLAYSLMRVTELMKIYQGRIDPVIYKGSQNILSDNSEQIDYSQDRYSNLFSIFKKTEDGTPLEYDKMEQAVDLFYTCNCHSKEDREQSNALASMYSKIVKQEASSQKIEKDLLFGNETFSSYGGVKSRKNHEFDWEVCLLAGTNAALNMSRKKGLSMASFKDMVKNEIINDLSSISSESLASLKSSALASLPLTMTPDEINVFKSKMQENNSEPLLNREEIERVLKNDDIESLRKRKAAEKKYNKAQNRKAIEGIAELIKEGIIGENPFASLDLVYEYAKRIGFTVTVSPKDQIGGIREIFKLHITYRILAKFIETTAASIGKQSDKEVLTKGKLKTTYVEAHDKIIEEFFSSAETEKMTATGSNDATTWAQNQTIKMMFTTIFALIPDDFVEPVATVLNMWVDKRIQLPDKLIKMMLTNPEFVSSTDDSFNILKRQFLGTDDKLFLFDEPFQRSIINKTNMLQGILHFLSSLVHTCMQENLEAMLKMEYDEWQSRGVFGKDCKFFFNAVITSDDSLIKMSVVMKKRKKELSETEKQVKKNEYLYITCFLSLSMYTIKWLYKYHGLQLSEEKSTYPDFSPLQEFNSTFAVGGTVIKGSVKFVYVSCSTPEGTSLESRQNEFSNLRKSCAESGCSMHTIGIIQRLQFMINYKLLGSLTSPLFHEYSLRIVYAPSGSCGFFFLEPDQMAIIGYRFAKWIAIENSIDASLVQKIFMARAEGDIDNLGMPNLRVTIPFGNSEKKRDFLLKLKVPEDWKKLAEEKLITALYTKRFTPEQVNMALWVKATGIASESYTRSGPRKIVASSVYILGEKAITATSSEMLTKDQVNLINRTRTRVYLELNLQPQGVITKEEEGLYNFPNSSKVSLIHLIDELINQKRKYENDEILENILMSDSEKRWVFPDREFFRLAYDTWLNFRGSNYRVRSKLARTEITLMIPRSDSLGITLLQCASAKWMNVQTKHTASEIDEVWKEYKNIYPFLKDDYYLTLKDPKNPYQNSPLQLYTFLTSAIKDAKVKVLGPIKYKMNTEDLLIQICQDMYHIGMSSREAKTMMKKRDKLRSVRDLENKVLDVNSILYLPVSEDKKSELIGQMMKNIIMTPSRMIPVEPNERAHFLMASRGNFRTSAVIFRLMQNDTFPYNLVDLREDIMWSKKGIFTHWIKEQRVDKEETKKEGRVVRKGDGIFAITYNNNPTLIYMTDDKLTRIETRNEKIMSTTFQILSKQIRNMGLIKTSEVESRSAVQIIGERVYYSPANKDKSKKIGAPVIQNNNLEVKSRISTARVTLEGRKLSIKAKIEDEQREQNVLSYYVPTTGLFFENSMVMNHFSSMKFIPIYNALIEKRPCPPNELSLMFDVFFKDFENRKEYSLKNPKFNTYLKAMTYVENLKKPEIFKQFQSFSSRTQQTFLWLKEVEALRKWIRKILENKLNQQRNTSAKLRKIVAEVDKSDEEIERERIREENAEVNELFEIPDLEFEEDEELFFEKLEDFEKESEEEKLMFEEMFAPDDDSKYENIFERVMEIKSNKISKFVKEYSPEDNNDSMNDLFKYFQRSLRLNNWESLSDVTYFSVGEDDRLAEILNWVFFKESPKEVHESMVQNVIDKMVEENPKLRNERMSDLKNKALQRLEERKEMYEEEMTRKVKRLGELDKKRKEESEWKILQTRNMMEKKKEMQKDLINLTAKNLKKIEKKAIELIKEGKQEISSDEE